MNLLEQLPRPGRVLIIRLRSLGDCVLTTPAIRILSDVRPDLRIAIAVEDRFRDVFAGNPAIHEVLPPSALAAARFRPHLAINFHGGTRSALLTAVSGARWRAGFAHFRSSWIYTMRIPRAQEILREERTVHTAEHLASAIFWLGAPRCEIPRASLFATPSPAGSPYAVLHPMASAADKTWPVERFIETARHLRDHCGLEPVFIAGPSDDMTAFRDERVVQGAALERIKSLLAGASLFIGNDSGPAHMAAAFGLPVIVLFGNSDPIVWSPWRTPAETITAGGSIREVPVSRVITAIDRLRVRA